MTYTQQSIAARVVLRWTKVAQDKIKDAKAKVEKLTKELKKLEAARDAAHKDFEKKTGRKWGVKSTKEQAAAMTDEGWKAYDKAHKADDKYQTKRFDLQFAEKDLAKAQAEVAKAEPPKDAKSDDVTAMVAELNAFLKSQKHEDIEKAVYDPKHNVIKSEIRSHEADDIAEEHTYRDGPAPDCGCAEDDEDCLDDCEDDDDEAESHKLQAFEAKWTQLVTQRMRRYPQFDSVSVSVGDKSWVAVWVHLKR